MTSKLFIGNGYWEVQFRRFPLGERYWLWEPKLNPEAHPIRATDDCVVLNSDFFGTVEIPGFVTVGRNTLLQSSPVNQIRLAYSDSSNPDSFENDQHLYRFGYYPILEYTGETYELGGDAYDKYRLKFVYFPSQAHESLVSGYVYLCPDSIFSNSRSLFQSPGGGVNFVRPKIRVCRAPQPRIAMWGYPFYEREVKVYSVYHTSFVREIGAVPVRDRPVMVSGRALVGDDREAVFGIVFGGRDVRGLNGRSQYWADVRRVWVETPYGNVLFLQNDAPSTDIVNFDRQVYDYNGGVPKSWRIAPKKNGYVYVGFPKLSYNISGNPSQRSAQGILFYWRDFSVFPAGVSGVVPCVVVVDSIVGEVRLPFSISVIGRTVKYRYSDYQSYGTIEFVAGVGSELYSGDELRSFFNGIYVVDGSVVEEYGYGSYVGAGERVIFPNVLRMELRIDGEDVFEKVVNIIGGVRYYDENNRLIFSGEIETSAGERRVSYNSLTGVVSVEFQNGVVRILKEKLLTADGEFDRNQLIEFFSIKPYEMIDGGAYDFVSWFSRDSGGQWRYRAPYSQENPPAFFTLGFWLRHFAVILGLDERSVPERLVIPGVKLEVLVFNCLHTGRRIINNRVEAVSDQWYELERIDEVDMMRFVVSAQKVMGATDGDSLCQTVGEALGRLLSLFDLRIVISGDKRFLLVSSYLPSSGDAEDVEVLEGYYEKVLQGREKDMVYVLPLFRPVDVGSDYVNGGTFPPPEQNWALDYNLLDNTLFTTPNWYFNAKWGVYGEARYSMRVEPRFESYYSASRLREGLFRVESHFLHIPQGYDIQLKWYGGHAQAAVGLYGVYLGSSLSVNWNVTPPRVENGILNYHNFGNLHSHLEYFYGVPALLDVGQSHHYNGYALGRLSRHALFYLRKVYDQDGLRVEKPAVLLPTPGGSMIQVTYPRPSFYKVVPSVAKWLSNGQYGLDYRGMEDYMGIVYRMFYKGEWRLFHEHDAMGIWEQVRRNVVGIEGEIVGVYDEVGKEVMYKGKRYRVVRAEPKRGEGKTRVVLKRIY